MILMGLTKFNLEERVVRFAEDIIDFCLTLPITSLNKRIIEQLIGSAGSVGANYMEATEAESRRDFRHKLSIAKKEVKEANHWLRLLSHSNPNYKDKIRSFWKEGHELLLIFSKSIKTSKSHSY